MNMKEIHVGDTVVLHGVVDKLSGALMYVIIPGVSDRPQGILKSRAIDVIPKPPEPGEIWITKNKGERKVLAVEDDYVYYRYRDISVPSASFSRNSCYISLRQFLDESVIK